jgi:RNA polymerase sigma-70 factor (ECF subfamily)
MREREPAFFTARKGIVGVRHRHYAVLSDDRISPTPASGPELVEDGTLARASRLPPAVLRRMVVEHYDFIWRLLARLGVGTTEVDDATQQVFMVVVSREHLDIKSGSERSFLYGVALRVAKEFRRRAQSAQRNVSEPTQDIVDRALDVELIAERSRARQTLDRILEQMPDKLREAFILFELEDMSVPEIALLLEVPTGTVASRLRRAREMFQTAVAELRAQGRGDAP